MQFRNLIFSLFLTMVCTASMAQDVHYTDYRFAPLFLNPAQTGGFYGTVRINAVYRDQFRTFTGQPYQSPMLMIDSPILRGFNPNHWIGVGMVLFTDRAGDIGLTSNAMLGSVSYHIGLDKKINQVVSFGVQYGFIQKKIGNPGAIILDDELKGTVSSIDREKLENFEANYSDLNAGITYKSRVNKTTSFELGAAYFHILQPSFSGIGINEISGRINVHGKWSQAVNPQFKVEPAVIFSTDRQVTNTNLQFNTSYLLKKKGNKSILSGIGYRFGDALEFLLGYQYKDWKFGFSYDMTTSSAAQYDDRFGALEFGIQKIFNIPKKPKIVPVILCPRL